MPFDRAFAEALVRTATENGWSVSLPNDQLPNPLRLQLSRNNETMNILVHARKLRPQSSEYSDHNRPPGEWHVQLTFDGDARGQRNFLRFEDGYMTLLLGFHRVDETYIVAAFDPSCHVEYSFSASVQTRQEYLDEALRDGTSIQVRGNAETVFVFRLENLFEYLFLSKEIHSLNELQLENVIRDPTTPNALHQAALRTLERDQLPTLEPEERQQTTTEIMRYLRNQAFRQGIIQAYKRCAICGFQYDYVLDAAHIVPVAEGGTDTYDNGLGLCPNCHRMFDRGLILVDENLKIYLHPQRAEEYIASGLAGSLNDLEKTLREELWLPDDPQYRPSPENLRKVFEARHR